MKRLTYLYGDENPCRVHLTPQEARFINVLNLNTWSLDVNATAIRVNLDLTLFEIDQFDSEQLLALEEFDVIQWFIDPVTNHVQATVRLSKEKKEAYVNACHILNTADELFKPHHKNNLVPRVRPAP